MSEGNGKVSIKIVETTKWGGNYSPSLGRFVGGGLDGVKCLPEEADEVFLNFLNNNNNNNNNKE